MSTRFVGTCPVCAARYKVRDGKLVHHGYRRPGHGYIVGDCFAVGLLPHEVSSATAKAYRSSVEAQIVILEGSRAATETADDLIHHYRNYHGAARSDFKLETVHVKRGDRARYEGSHQIPGFDDLRTLILTQLRGQLESARSEVTRMTTLIDTWTEQPLMTFEEETARVTLEKTAAREAKKAEREAKKAAQKAKKGERNTKRNAKLRGQIEAAQAKAWAILDAVDSKDVRAVREAYLKVLSIKLPSAIQYTFYDEHLGRTELLRSAGLVRAHTGGLMRSEFEVLQLLAGR